MKRVLSIAGIILVVALLAWPKVKGYFSNENKSSAPAARSASVLQVEAFIVKGDTVENNIFTTGKPKEYVKIGDSGRKRIQAFCGKCSTSLYSTSLKRDKFSLRTGFLDQRDHLIPKKHIYGRSSAKWLKNI